MDAFHADCLEAYPVPSFPDAPELNRPLRLRLAGRYEHLTNHNMPRRVLEEYVVILCTDGEGWVRVGDSKTRPVHPGDLLFLPPGIPHSYGSAAQNFWSLLWFHCQGEQVDYFYGRFLARLPGRRNEPLPSPGANVYFTDIVSLTKNLTSYVGLLHAESIVCQVFCSVTAPGAPNPADVRGDELARAIIQWMEDTRNYGISLDELAGMFGISKYHMIRLFRSYTGTTPMDYFQQIRLKRSCSMLAEGRWTIGEISSILGYSSPYHYSKMFKQFFGLPPRAFKKMLY